MLTGQELKRTNSATIKFTSDAPLEIIKATSNSCQGILDLESGKFAFKIFIKSFDGFNSPLQKEHFYENYMEVSQFPEATFAGKLIEEYNPSGQDKTILRAKGNLNIHGVEKERIIEVVLLKSGDDIEFNSSLDVLLKDHNIEIPSIVRQKIAEKIMVTVSGILR
jgi:polyisoprenoid-binding protein YceI